MRIDQLLYMDSHVGSRCFEIEDGGRHQIDRHRWGRADADITGRDALDILNLVERVIELCFDRDGAPDQGFSRGRRDHTMAESVEKLAAELRFQRLDAFGHGGLRQVQIARRLSHAASATDSDKVSELIEFHFDYFKLSIFEKLISYSADHKRYTAYKMGV